MPNGDLLVLDRAFRLPFRFSNRLSLVPEFEPVRNKVFGYGPKDVKMTQDALEVLSLVAYKQPISRLQVASIRGVDPDAVIRTLQARGYVGEVGRDPGPGQAILFGTTPLLPCKRNHRARSLPAPSAGSAISCCQNAKIGPGRASIANARSFWPVP